MALIDQLIRDAISGTGVGRMKYGYRSGKLTYIGYHAKPGASADDPDWQLKKLTYSGDDVIDITLAKTGVSWSGLSNAQWS